MSSLDDRGFKRFSGEDDDAGKQLRKFKAWAQAKMATLKDFAASQQGPWIYTLLDGKALESVEHLTLEDLQKEGGAAQVWTLLQERFPEKESEDQMGEALGECFGLCAKEGESMQQWAARVHEVFQKCRRKAAVEFPSVAQGWIALNCSGLTEEQRAIVKAKTQGRLELPTITAALRSCFPQFRASTKARKPVSTLYVENEEDGEGSAADADGATDPFADVEAFLADHNVASDANEAAEVDESEAAEALAISWRERRQEINKLQKSRRFGQAASTRKSFRVEIAELKKRTRCRRCNGLGHWARECKANVGVKGKDTSISTSSSAAAQADVNLAQIAYDDEVAFVGAAELLSPRSLAACKVLSSGLVSSPGYGIVDSGCGRTLIGKQTLSQLEKLLPQHTARPVERYEARSSFRFGNGAREDSQLAVRIIDAAVTAGQAPLLLGRPTLEKMQVVLDFSHRCMKFLGQEQAIPMHSNSAGQLLINILAFPGRKLSGCLVVSPHDSALSLLDSSVSTKHQSEDGQVCSHDVPAPAETADNPTATDDMSPPCPECLTECPTPEVPSVPETEPSPRIGPKSVRHKRKLTLKPKECRCLLAQVRHMQRSQDSQIAVAELFSEPRVTLEAQRHGATGLAFDIKQGCDLLNPDTQQEVSDLLELANPQLLTASPPCTHWGGVGAFEQVLSHGPGTCPRCETGSSAASLLRSGNSCSDPQRW